MSKLPLSLFFLFFLTVLPLEVISQTGVNTIERSILLDLKQRLGNPPFTTNWNSSSSPCVWPAVQCTGDSVTGLLLGNVNITVEIPSTICSLGNLTLLDLSWNFIPGGFPTLLYNCSKLQYLDLSQNYFSGTIPIDVDRLSSGLRYLDLGGNSFFGDIPPAIGRLTELRTLGLYQSEYNGTFPKEIGDLSNLEVLKMAYNDKLVPAKIPVEFGKLKKLTYLWMKNMNLIGEIPDAVAKLSSLEHVDLAINDLEGKLPGEFFSFKNLTYLYLFNNGLSGDMPASIQALSLIEIDISKNKLTGSIPEDISKLQKLEVLQLFDNMLTGDLPSGIGLLPALKLFSVFNNELSGILPPEIGFHSKLEEFDVSSNQFHGGLPENLCTGKVLQSVVAFSNNLTGNVPESLGDCRTLRTLQLYNNRFTGEIPSGVWATFNISSLMISNNSFTGKLPKNIAWNLSRIEISNNMFSGEIPRSIASWSRLIVLQASNNLFSGEIPKELTYLSNLIDLSLDGNRISGELPVDIISWKSLITLNLAGNKLSGKIPSVIGFLPRLLNLDLSKNQFSGEIPSEIGNLKLTTLNFSSNKLSGSIPQSFNNLAFENSFLNNSNLCAHNPLLNLPNCRAKFTDSTKLPTRLLALILTLVVIVIFTVVSIVFLLRDFRRKKHRQDLSTWKLTSFQKLDFTEVNILSSLTENNQIGSGGSGKVYRIAVNNAGEYVAVKRIWNSKKLDHKSEKEFLAEVEILSTIKHGNIVKLLCCISSDDSKLLVYEYMENKSLDQWLYGKNRRSSEMNSGNRVVVLDWPRRLQIAIGAAQGLCYMHHDCSTPIIHRDVKSSNILLDSEFKARIADFGLAKMLINDGEAHTMSAVAGSFGYFAPEYAYTRKITEKIDVYSFGVVLLELVTGKKPYFGDERTSLAEWSWKAYQDEKPVADIYDDDINNEQRYVEEVTTVFKLGLICTSTLPSNRPSMKEVVQILRRCSSSSEEKGAKKSRGAEYDVAPLLGAGGYVFGKRSKKGENGDGFLVYNV